MAAAAPIRVSAHIAPSLLASDFSQLGAEARRVIEAGADWLHLDIMDGHFVPNITMGAPVIKCLRQAVPKGDAFFDCHCMIENPERWVSDFAAAGADQFTFHAEATDDIGALIAQIRAAGMEPAVAIKPGTDVEALFPFCDDIHMALVMTVEPGFGGQSFMPDMMPKVRALRERFPAMNIQVDGGLSPTTVDQAAQAGANVIVAGTAVFRAEDPAAVITTLREAVEGASSSWGSASD